MEFEQYMNPPVLTNILDQMEEETRTKKKYKDAIANYDSKKKELSLDVYWGKAGYAVYSFDGTQFVIRKENAVEINKEVKNLADKEDKRICKIMEVNYEWAVKHFSE